MTEERIENDLRCAGFERRIGVLDAPHFGDDHVGSAPHEHIRSDGPSDRVFHGLCTCGLRRLRRPVALDEQLVHGALSQVVQLAERQEEPI